MSLEKIDKIKADKGFKLADLIIYAAIAVIIVAVFLAVFLTRDSGELSGISVSVNDNEIFTYSFSSRKYEVLDDERIGQIEENDEILYIEIFCDKGYNVLKIDIADGVVSISDADCRGGDCLYQKIENNSGMIYCSPHRLRVVPYGFDGDDGNIIV